MARVSDELVSVHSRPRRAAHSLPARLELQRQIHGQRGNDEIPDTCLLLRREPVFTAGKRTSPLDRPQGTRPEVDRGGKITWPSPGQLRPVQPAVRAGLPPVPAGSARRPGLPGQVSGQLCDRHRSLLAAVHVPYGDRATFFLVTAVDKRPAGALVAGPLELAA